MQSACFTLLYVSCPTLQYFSTLFRKWRDFLCLLNIEKACFDFFHTFFLNISHSKKNRARRTDIQTDRQRNIAKLIAAISQFCESSCKVHRKINLTNYQTITSSALSPSILCFALVNILPDCNTTWGINPLSTINKWDLLMVIKI
jgi:hypothetical protein